MKRLNGLNVMIGILVMGIGLLGGGFVGALTGSLGLGGMPGGGVAVTLFWGARDLGRRRKQFRLIGEVQEGVPEEDFTLLAEEPELAKKRVQEKVRQRPGRVADSIRSMLVEKKNRRSQ